MIDFNVCVRKNELNWFYSGAQFLICILVCLTSILYFADTSNAEKSGSKKQSSIDLRPSTTDNLDIYKIHEADYQHALKQGVGIVNLPNYKTFFVFWVPPQLDRMSRKLAMVTLHGTDGNAYKQLTSLLDTATREGFALISIQYAIPKKVEENPNGPAKEILTYEYINPEKIFEIIGTAINYMTTNFQIDKHSNALLCVDKLAVDTPVYAFMDKHYKTNYFNCFIGVSGSSTPDHPMLKDLLSGKYGDVPLRGKHFFFWCGIREAGTCTHMKETQDIIQKLGGAVDVFRGSPEGRDGFFKSPQYKVEAAKFWKRLYQKNIEKK
jgi:hypothetical protein